MHPTRRTFLKLAAGAAAAAAVTRTASAAPPARSAGGPGPSGSREPEPHSRAAPQGTPPALTRSMVRANGVDLFVRDTGGNLPALLLLHGMQGRGETFTDLIARHRDRYRVIAPDMRGHGLSGRPVARYATEDLAADAQALLRTLGVSPAIVAGHSFGGLVAAFVAALYPQDVRALALLDPPFDGPERPSDRAPDTIPDQDPMIADWPLPYPSRADAIRDLAARFPGPAYPGFFADSLVESVAGYTFMWSGRGMAAIYEYRQGSMHLLPRIACPVLLLKAQTTRVLSAERAAQVRGILRNCTYAEIPSCGHMLYLENPDGFNREFDAWLGRVGTR